MGCCANTRKDYQKTEYTNMDYVLNIMKILKTDAKLYYYKQGDCTACCIYRLTSLCMYKNGLEGYTSKCKQ